MACRLRETALALAFIQAMAETAETAVLGLELTGVGESYSTATSWFDVPVWKMVMAPNLASEQGVSLREMQSIDHTPHMKTVKGMLT